MFVVYLQPGRFRSVRVRVGATLVGPGTHHAGFGLGLGNLFERVLVARWGLSCGPCIGRIMSVCTCTMAVCWCGCGIRWTGHEMR